MKYFHAFLTFLFALFAYFQWNDPDGIRWILIYGFVAVIMALTFYKVQVRGFIIIGIAGYTMGILYLLPDFIVWIDSGMPSIAGEMKAGSPFIEVIREFLGLVLCLLALTYLFFFDRSRKRKMER